MDSMAVSLIQLLINICRAYLAAGVVFALPFVVFWVHRVDPSARGGAIGFRLIIIPGVAALWPLFAIRLLRGKSAPTERTAHRLNVAKEMMEGG
ncbi:MAG: hypothetical protein F6K19_43735 [Cyanothece sp. SIO1E1]|nr:hypothetical protein [Cyanothece sp. SIO1E1]